MIGAPRWERMLSRSLRPPTEPFSTREVPCGHCGRRALVVVNRKGEVVGVTTVERSDPIR